VRFRTPAVSVPIESVAASARALLVAGAAGVYCPRGVGWPVDVPPGHAVHTAASGVVEPGGPYEPGAHGVPRHTKAPVAVIHVPPAHGAHVPGAGGPVPKRGPYEPDGHGVPAHAVAPGALVYVPDGHDGHDPALVPNCEKEPGAHAAHTVSDVETHAPAANCPPGQLRQPRHQS
jgi:hypothetical protein